MSSENVIIKMRQGADPAVDRIVIDHDGSRTSHVSSDPSSIVAAAVQVADGGADRIELFGGFEPGDAARVIEAIDARAPVGVPGYGYAGAERR